MTTERNNTGYNSTFAIGGVSCSADSFVVAESFVLRINISGKNPAHRKSAKRCTPLSNPRFETDIYLFIRRFYFIRMFIEKEKRNRF